jgi:hypothetical protein
MNLHKDEVLTVEEKKEYQVKMKTTKEAKKGLAVR